MDHEVRGQHVTLEQSKTNMWGRVQGMYVLYSLGRLKGFRLETVLGNPVHVTVAFVPWYPAVLLLRAAALVCVRTIHFSGITLG